MAITHTHTHIRTLFLTRARAQAGYVDLLARVLRRALGVSASDHGEL